MKNAFSTILLVFLLSACRAPDESAGRTSAVSSGTPTGQSSDGNESASDVDWTAMSAEHRTLAVLTFYQMFGIYRPIVDEGEYWGLDNPECHDSEGTLIKTTLNDSQYPESTHWSEFDCNIGLYYLQDEAYPYATGEWLHKQDISGNPRLYHDVLGATVSTADESHQGFYQQTFRKENGDSIVTKAVSGEFTSVHTEVTSGTVYDQDVAYQTSNQIQDADGRAQYTFSGSGTHDIRREHLSGSSYRWTIEPDNEIGLTVNGDWARCLHQGNWRFTAVTPINVVFSNISQLESGRFDGGELSYESTTTTSVSTVSLDGNDMTIAVAGKGTHVIPYSALMDAARNSNLCASFAGS